MKKMSKNAMIMTMALSMGTAVVAPVIANTVQADAMGVGVFGEKGKVKNTHAYYLKSKSGNFNHAGYMSKGSIYTVGKSYEKGYYKVYYKGKTVYVKSGDVLKDI
ncbi:hypothetical protein CVD28_24610 [Bacillus sp. M6-12]|uniref:hypothetical protein n=1 Tax=Bacillus sp. M6-12 TaxID=2054166 RepID=UPI000C7814C3|nr:hypothetical protein [Bacillus sp. M6-12]PLS15063.1 hypothetical protein CVD28_24610 [Bacillus sp. M6-12]